MKCRYCNIALAPLRSLTDGEFCCDDHRHAFSEEQAAGTEVFLQPPPQDALLPLAVSFSGGIPGSAAGPMCALELREFKLTVVKPASSLLTPETEMFSPDPPFLDRLLPLHFSAAPADADTGCTEELPGDLEFPGVIALPQSELDQISIPIERELAPAPEMIPPAEPALSFESKAIPEEELVETVPSYREVANSWHWLRDAWRNAPRDLKVVTVLLPVLLAVAVGPSVRKGKGHVASTPSLPSVHALPSLPSLRSMPAMPSSPAGNVQQVVADRLTNLHQTILNRAAVDLTDDFRSGLDAWESRSNLTTSWSYDATGFVQPGPLAVFKPSTDLMDYRFQFLGEIDQKGLGAAFRASNLDNYYAVKLVVVKPGPLPVVHLVRYAVINGQEERHVEKPLQLAARPDTLYRMVVDVRGSDFTIMAQGQLVDFWTDNRLPRGGVGFFCSRGEKARVRWVEVSHQYDALGRLCAYLAPYGFEGRNGNFN
jgi:hypothetical protein